MRKSFRQHSTRGFARISRVIMPALAILLFGLAGTNMAGAAEQGDPGALITDARQLQELEEALKLLGYWYAENTQLYAPVETADMQKAIQRFGKKNMSKHINQFDAHLKILAGQPVGLVYQLALEELNALSPEERSSREQAIAGEAGNQRLAEVDEILRQCNTRVWDCDCVGRAFAKEREKRPDDPVNSIRSDLLGVGSGISPVAADCFAREAYAETTARECQHAMVATEQFPSEEAAAEYCNCVGETKSKLKQQSLKAGNGGSHATRKAASAAMTQCRQN